MSDELLQYRHFVSKQQSDKDLTDDQEEEVLAQFAALDPDRKGQIEWSDFLYFESLAVLRKLRTEVKRRQKRLMERQNPAAISPPDEPVAVATIGTDRCRFIAVTDGLSEPREQSCTCDLVD